MSDAAKTGRVITFYSFKGGTGRTMALANVGCLLAQRAQNKPVLLIDWDLEAPGLHRYFESHLVRSLGNVEQELPRRLGLIDLFYDIKQIVDELSPAERGSYDVVYEALRSVPIRQYAIATDLPNLSLIIAGRMDADYSRRISEFSWEELFETCPVVFQCFADIVTAEYEFVLIDSRTGFTDSGGICTALLPEVLVAVFTPNRQSLVGVGTAVTDAVAHRSDSDDLRPIIVYPLPSRIDADEPELRAEWRFGNHGYQTHFEALFKKMYGSQRAELDGYFSDIQLQHIPSFSYGEKIAVLSEASQDRFSLTQSYVQIAEHIRQQVAPWSTTDSLVDVDRSVEPVNDWANASRTSRDRRILSKAQKSVDIMERDARKYKITFISMLFMSAALFVLGVGGSAPAFSLWEENDILVRSMILSLGGATIAMIGYSSARSNSILLELERIKNAIFAYESKSKPYNDENRSALFERNFEYIIGRDYPVSSSRKNGKFGKIFISYRRQDTMYAVDRLHAELALHVPNPRRDITMDIDSIPPGVDFVSRIDELVSHCDVLLAVIGKNWLDATDMAGRRRIDDPDDFVRLEISSALRRGIPVVPVLIDGVILPRASSLPDDIRELARRNAVVISRGSFQSDVEYLARDLGLLR